MKQKNLLLLSFAIMQTFCLNNTIASENVNIKEQVHKIVKQDLKTRHLKQMTNGQIAKLETIIQEANVNKDLNISKHDQKKLNHLGDKIKAIKEPESIVTIDSQFFENVPAEIPVMPEYNEVNYENEGNVNVLKAVSSTNVGGMRAVQQGQQSLYAVNANIISTPYFVKVYHNDLNNYQENLTGTLNEKDGVSYKFSIGGGINNEVANKKIEYDNDSQYATIGIQNKNENLTFSFDAMYKEKQYDIGQFKDVKDKMAFASAYVNDSFGNFNVDLGYIFMNKLDSKINSNKSYGLSGKLNLNGHRLFTTIGTKLYITDGLYFGIKGGINADIIDLSSFEVTDTLGNKTKIKDKNIALISESVDLTLNQELYKLLDNVKIDLFAGLNFNYTNKDIQLTDKNGDKTNKFKLKDYNYFNVGTKININDTFDIDLKYKGNLTVSHDNSANIGLNINL